MLPDKPSNVVTIFPNIAPNPQIPLQNGGGDGIGGGMDVRVTRLETHMDNVRESLAEIKLELKGISQSQTDIKTTLAGLPTRGGLWGMVATVIATAIAVIGLFVGILTYLHEIMV
jgi:hypothetical protein